MKKNLTRLMATMLALALAFSLGACAGNQGGARATPIP
jgi:hypothetical protein